MTDLADDNSANGLRVRLNQSIAHKDNQQIVEQTPQLVEIKVQER